MASLREMRRRLGSVRSIRQITKAMKMVAAARLRRAQESILAARPYAQRIEDVLHDIASRHDVSDTPLLRPSGGEFVYLLVITADKGLCGSFNANILRRAARFVHDQGKRPVKLITVGKKARDYFHRRGVTPRHAHVDVYRHLSFTTASSLRDELVDPYREGIAGEVHMVYNEFKSAMAQRLVCRQLLPVLQEDMGHRAMGTDFEYEPSAGEVFSALLPHYFAIEIWRALLESYSAELGARMTAMDSATRNASDMIGRLTLVSNRIRQAAITREIAEIVGGAEALK